jgi:hypothetical protein
MMDIDSASAQSMALVGLDLWALVLAIKKQMARRLHFLVVVLATHLVLNVTLLLLKTGKFHTNIYAQAYWACHTMLFVASLYMVECLWEMGLSRYQGFHRLCLMAVAVTMVALLGFVGFIVSQSPNVTVPNNWINMWFLLISRSVHLAVAALILAFFVFASIFRIQVTRTVRDLAASLLVFSIVRALLQTWLYDHNDRAGTYYWSLWSLSMAVMLCSWLWIVAHHKEAEACEIPPVFPSHLSREVLELRAQAANRKLIRLLG